MNAARRIAALLLLHPALDGNYRRIKNACVPLPAGPNTGQSAGKA